MTKSDVRDMVVRIMADCLNVDPAVIFDEDGVCSYWVPSPEARKDLQRLLEAEAEIILDDDCFATCETVADLVDLMASGLGVTE